MAPSEFNDQRIEIVVQALDVRNVDRMDSQAVAEVAVFALDQWLLAMANNTREQFNREPRLYGLSFCEGHKNLWEASPEWLRELVETAYQEGMITRSQGYEFVRWTDAAIDVAFPDGYPTQAGSETITRGAGL